MKIDNPGTAPPLPCLAVPAFRGREADAARGGDADAARLVAGALRARTGAAVGFPGAGGVAFSGGRGDVFSAGPEGGVRDFDLESRRFVLSDMRLQNHPISRSPDQPPPGDQRVIKNPRLS